MQDDHSDSQDSSETLLAMPISLLSLAEGGQATADANADSGDPEGTTDDAAQFAASPVANRRRVMDALAAKGRKLTQCQHLLDSLRDRATNPTEYEKLDNSFAEVTIELDLCRARFTAIDRGRPFTQPGREQELALLDAIQSVTDAVANTNALGTLLGAIHELVLAYPAIGT